MFTEYLHFIDKTAYESTVFVEDSGGYKLHGKEVIISGDNGQAEGISDENDGKVVAKLNPGTYTVYVKGADPETKEIGLLSGNVSINMTIPVKIEIEISPKPRVLGNIPEGTLTLLGLTPEDNPEGYMVYYPPDPIKHNYTIKATANGHAVGSYTLYVWDEVSMMTEDAPQEQELLVTGRDGTYSMIAGLPKMTDDDPPLAATKTIKFWAAKKGYKNSDKVSDEVIVLGDLPVGSAARLMSIPALNYMVLHDPPGDNSYAYIDDSLSIKGVIGKMSIRAQDKEIPVYPSPWRQERYITNFNDRGDKFGGAIIGAAGVASGAIGAIMYGIEVASDKTANIPGFYDLELKGLLGYKDSDPTLGWFTLSAATQFGVGAAAVAIGPFSWIIQVVGMGVKAGLMTEYGVQYEVKPNRRLQTPSGDSLPHMLGPGKGDTYFGEGWLLGLQTKYRMGLDFKTDATGKKTPYRVTKKIETYDILGRKNQYIYTVYDIENIIKELDKVITNMNSLMEEEAEKNGTHTETYKKMEKDKTTLTDAKDNRWQKLLDKNLAYVWNRDYVGSETTTFNDFLNSGKGAALKDKPSETLVFTGGPVFEYSRTISEANSVGWSEEIAVEVTSAMSSELEASTGFELFGSGITVKIKTGAESSLKMGSSYGKEFESGESTEQSVGFVLQDDDVGDNFTARVYADPIYGTPVFFQDPGCISSNPWEPGTNKGEDAILELIEEPAETAASDYREGKGFKVKVKFTGMRDIGGFGHGFNLYSAVPANSGNAYVLFNGQNGPYDVGLSGVDRSAIVEVTMFPPKSDWESNEEKEYSVDIILEAAEDEQISRSLTLKAKFADLRAPQARIIAPYPGERISPVFFPKKDPFDIEVVSNDKDVANIQLQIRSKQPNGVWEPWRNLSGMNWNGTNTEVVTLFEYLDQRPIRKEFTFRWTDAEIKGLGVGEYAIRAIAKDKATNTDLDPPDVVFLVDESKPSVLTSIPDYQARDKERIYRGELSVLFTDDMRAMDFSDRTFLVWDLLDNKMVGGYVSYSPALRKAIFVPIVPFKPNGFYRVEIKTDEEKNGKIDAGVHDLAGNPLDNAFMWTFRTLDSPFEPVWSIVLSATDNDNTDGNNIATVEYNALDGEDEKDARAVPSLANQLRLSFLDNNYVEFDRDTRPADSRLSHHWFFAINNANKGATVTINWQPSIKLTKSDRQYTVIWLVEFDEKGNVINTKSLDPTKAEMDDETNEIKPMLAYEYVNKGERSRYFRLDVQKIGAVIDTFKKGSSGWKFFSTPIIPQIADPFVNLGDDIDPFKLYQYDQQIKGYRIYPFDVGYVSLKTGYSYFTHLEQDVVVDVGGANNFDDVNLKMELPGWYTIGNPFLLPVNVADLQISSGSSSYLFTDAVAHGLIEGTLYRWDVIPQSGTVSDGYVGVTSKDKLLPWEGYWLRTRQGTMTITIPAPSGLKTFMPKIPDFLKPPVFRLSPMMIEQGVLAPQFELALELLSPYASDRATMLGTHKEAKIGNDRFDSKEPPIMAKTVAAYFDHANDGLYNLDYQPAMNTGEERRWQLTVYAELQKTLITLSWEKAIANVPANIMLTIRKEGESDWQDMRKIHKQEILTTSMLITEVKFEICAKQIEISSPPKLRVAADKGQKVMLFWNIDDNPNITEYLIKRWDKNNNMKEYRLKTNGRQLIDEGKKIEYSPKSNEVQFVDTDVTEETTYIYQLFVCYNTGAQVSGEQIISMVQPLINKVELLPCYPNPSNSGIYIPYELAEATDVKIMIYNVAGELVRRLDMGTQPAGSYVANNKVAYWNGYNDEGEKVASGIYFYVFKAGNFMATRKMGICR